MPLRHPAVRWPLTIVLTLGLGWFAGPTIWSGGYGGCVLWVLSMIACPLAVALVAPRFPYVFAPLTNLLVELSLARTRYNWMSEHSEQPWEWFAKSLNTSYVTAAISVTVGAVVGLSVHAWRKRPGHNQPMQRTGPAV